MSGGVPQLPSCFTLEELELNLRVASVRCMQGDEAAEADCEKWGRLLSANPEKIRRDEAERERWEEHEAPLNAAALQRTRRLVPPDVATGASKATLLEAGATEAWATRLMTERLLWLVRSGPQRIAKTALADLRRLNTSSANLDVVELRALYAAIPPTFDADADGSKRAWREDLRTKLIQALKSGEQVTRHPAYADVACDLDLSLPPLFDPEMKEVALTATSSLGPAEAREAELEAIMRHRREASEDASTTSKDVPKLRAAPRRLAADDPRTRMLAGIKMGDGDAPKPDFLAQIALRKQQQPQQPPSSSSSKPSFFAELLEKNKKKQQAAGQSDTAEQSSSSKPSFLAELQKKQKEKQPTEDASLTPQDDLPQQNPDTPPEPPTVAAEEEQQETPPAAPSTDDEASLPASSTEDDPDLVTSLNFIAEVLLRREGGSSEGDSAEEETAAVGESTNNARSDDDESLDDDDVV